jgi:hypothetical protein
MVLQPTSSVRRLNVKNRIDFRKLEGIISHTGIDAAVDRRNLLRDLGRAWAYYNTRLDLSRNKTQVAELCAMLARVEKHASELTVLLDSRKYGDVLHELQMSRATSLRWRRNLRQLAASASKAQPAVRKRSFIIDLKWSLNAELVAKLAIIFEENFGKPAGYAREKEMHASANAFIRFVTIVFRQFGLPARSSGSIANDLTKVAARIEASKARQA